MSTILKTSITALVFIVSGFVGVLPATAADPGIRHTVFMAGSVIESSAEGIYLCIGAPEGAKAGQVLDVVRLTRDRSVNPKQGIRFTSEKVGTIMIDAIVDEHFARATPVEGHAEKGDIVRLSHAESSKD